MMTMAGAGRFARMVTLLLVVGATIACDRFTKDAAAGHLAGRPRLSLAADSIRLEYAENRGGFLSLGADLSPTLRIALFNVGTTALLAGLGVWVFRRALGGSVALGPALLWAGGVANVADRIGRGRVIDFLNLGVGGLRTGIFNVADVAITAGVLLVLLELRERRLAQE
jgi:signal peptidase II